MSNLIMAEKANPGDLPNLDDSRKDDHGDTDQIK